ncbi:hypothetical protein BGZ98_001134 [Dissophora globulifera]|nr:hypothetical protein BGZ98_001134 [Dissophora globulifera]
MSARPSLPPSSGVEVVLKSVELESPSTVLRNRRYHRTAPSISSSTQLSRQSTLDDGNSSHIASTPDNTSARKTPVTAIMRKPSFSSIRDHIPSNINTEPGAFKLSVDESSPIEKTLKHAPLGTQALEPDNNSNNNNDNSGTNDGDDADSDFDWEEDKIHEVKDKDKDAQANPPGTATLIESDVCCRPLNRRIHPRITWLARNVLVVVFFLIPKFILTHVHTHHHNTIVLIEGGKPYMAVVIGNHLSYFVIQFLIIALFKVIHHFGTVKVKITLETHDGLVPHIARSVWLFVLIVFWVVYVHYPTCDKARIGLDFPASIEEGVDMQCRRWIFWWVHRCLWGIQAMNMLYILKRYTMQILSDRFEQDNSKFVELNFQGHVLDNLQKIRPPRPHRASGFHGTHSRWAEKSTSWLATATTTQVNRSPNPSRPSSTKDEKPPTANMIDREPSPKRSTWELLKNSFQRRAKKSHGVKIRTASSPSGSISEVYRDHELEPQEFVRMSKKRKTKLIHSLRNKPIENPYKKAKDLWTRICPPHRNHLEQIDLEQPFKKDIMDRVWKLFDPNGGDIVTRAMFKQTIVDMVNLRKSFTSTHKTFENAMAKLDMLFNIVVLLFVIVAFLIAYDVGVQQYAVGVSSLVVGCAFVTGTSAKNAFESMVFIFVMGAYFMIKTIHILTTEMKRGDGMLVLAPNYLLATRHIHNLSRSSEHVDNVWMDIPLFSSGRTILKIKQKIQQFCENEAAADYHKIDVILNSTNNHTKDGTSKACLQILFRVFHRNRWIDPDFGPRKLKSILFLRATLNELEQEDLNDLIAVRRALAYGNHGGDGSSGSGSGGSGGNNETSMVVNEAGQPVGYVGTSGNVYDPLIPQAQSSAGAGVGAGMTRNDLASASELAAVYMAHEITEAAAAAAAAANQRPPFMHAAQNDGALAPSYYANLDTTAATGEGALSQGQHNTMHGQFNNLSARHVLAPETIQLSTNGANFQPFPNGFQFQR